MAFSQFIAAFSGMPKEQQASAKFLQKQCFLLNFRHFYRTTIDQEYLPSMFKAAARLLCKCKVTSNYSALSYIFSKMLSQTSRHYLARPLQRQRQDRYSAADRFYGEYLSAALRSQMAFSLLDLTASLKRHREFVQFDYKTMGYSQGASLEAALTLFGMYPYVSYFNSYLIVGRSSSLFQTGFKDSSNPAPTLCCRSIFLLFLKMGDCIQSMCCLSAIGIFTILFVNTSFSFLSLAIGGAGMMLLMSSATLNPIFLGKRVQKMFFYEPLFEEYQDRLSWRGALGIVYFFYVDFSNYLNNIKGSTGSLVQLMTSELTVFVSVKFYFCSAYDFVYFWLYLELEEENTFYSICFFFNQNYLIYFYRSGCPNFNSFIPQSIDDRLPFNLFALYSLVQFRTFSSPYVLGSIKVTGMVEPILDVFSIIVVFLTKNQLTISLLGVELFYLALSYLLILFFMREEDFITSYNLDNYGLRNSVYFYDCLSCDWQRSFYLQIDSNVSFNFELRLMILFYYLSFNIGNLLSSFAKFYAASMMADVHSTSAKQAWIYYLLNSSGCVPFAKSLMAFNYLALILRQSRFRMR